MSTTTRSKSSSSETDPRPISYEKIFSMMKTIESKIDNSHVTFNENIKTMQSSIEQQINTWKVSFENTILKYSTDFEKKFKDLSNDVETRIRSVEEINEDAERKGRLNDIIIHGVNRLENENLFTLFSSVAKAVNFQFNDIRSAVDSIFRLGANGPILVKFTTYSYKMDFFFKYINHGQLNLKDVGYKDVDNRIYINDNLTHRNNLIYKRAYQLKKSNNITDAVTRNGFVFIRITKNSKYIKIVNVAKLDSLSIVNGKERNYKAVSTAGAAVGAAVSADVGVGAI